MTTKVNLPKINLIDYHTIYTPDKQSLDNGNVFHLIEIEEMGWVNKVEVVKCKDNNMYFVKVNNNVKGLFGYDMLVEWVEDKCIKGFLSSPPF